MDVSREDVLRCAALARLSLREEEIEPLRRDMERLLSHAQSLDALDLEAVAPWSPDTPLPRREDVPVPGLTQAEALANAPRAEKGHFVVPKAL